MQAMLHELDLIRMFLTVIEVPTVVVLLLNT